MLRLSKLLFIALALSIFIGSDAGGSGSEESNKPARRKLKILAYAPNSAFSHFNLMVRLCELLADRGHAVTMVMPNILDHNTPRTTEYRVIKTKKGEEPKWLGEGWEGRVSAIMGSSQRFIEKNLKEWATMLEVFGAYDALETARDTKLMNELMEEKFDVGISEAWYFGGFAIHALLEIKTTIFANAQPLYPALTYFLGLPHPDHIPEMYSAQVGDGIEMTEERKQENEIEYWHSIGAYLRAFNRVNEQFNDIARELYEWKTPFPRLQDLFRKASYVFVNTCKALDFERPLPPQVNYFGGITMRPGDNDLKELKQETEELIANAKGKPIIVFSFGSAYDPNRIPRGFLNAFLETFAEFKEYEFIWRYWTDDKETNKLIKQHSNLQTVRWLQQKELLNLSQTKAFISHCGLNSVNEAVSFGVPLICIPLLGDQPYNSAMVEHRGIGVFLQLVTKDGPLTADSIKEGVRKVLSDHLYSENMKAIKDKLDHPDITPAELFVSHVEAAAKVGDENANTRIMGELPDKWTYISAEPREGINMFAAPPSASPDKALAMQKELENMEAQEKQIGGAQSVPSSSSPKMNNPKGSKKPKNSKKKQSSKHLAKHHFT